MRDWSDLNRLPFQRDSSEGDKGASSRLLGPSWGGGRRGEKTGSQWQSLSADRDLPTDPRKKKGTSHQFLTSLFISGGQLGVALDRKEGK